MCVNSFRMFIYLFSISSEGYHFSVPFVIFLVCFCLFLFVFVCFEVKSRKWATSTEAQRGECFDKRIREYNPKYKTEQKLQIQDWLAYLKY